jgi:hypothetical protein
MDCISLCRMFRLVRMKFCFNLSLFMPHERWHKWLVCLSESIFRCFFFFFYLIHITLESISHPSTSQQWLQGAKVACSTATIQDFMGSLSTLFWVHRVESLMWSPSWHRSSLFNLPWQREFQSLKQKGWRSVLRLMPMSTLQQLSALAAAVEEALLLNWQGTEAEPIINELPPAHSTHCYPIL